MTTLLIGCGDDINNNYGPAFDDGGANGTLTDTDGDGLSNAEEALLGTSPRLADTDGDGFGDFQEVVEFGFNPDNNNFRFNPLIADVPKIRVEITSVPSIDLLYETSQGATVTRGVERSSESASTVTTSDTSSNSRTVEETHTTGVEVSYEAGILGGFGGSVSYEYSHSTSNQSAFSHTSEQSQENRRALSESEAYEQTSGSTGKGGELAVSVRVQNDGDVAFKLDSLVLGSVMVDSLNRADIEPVANLNLDTTFNSFSAITLAPKTATGNLVFHNEGLDLATAKRLLSDASGLIVNVAASEVVDANGVAFAFRQTDISAKTATVIVDYGRRDRASERYLVATNANQQTGRVPLVTALTDILQLPYSVAADGSLESVRGLAADAALNSYWVAVHITNNGLETVAATLNPQVAGYDLQSRELKAGDVLQLTYMEDADGDGVGLRAEFFAGTDPDLPDTDGDGLSDGEELKGYDLTVDFGDGRGPVTKTVRSNPTLTDTDGDGFADGQELATATGPWSTDPSRADSDGDRITDSYDPQPTVYTNIAKKGGIFAWSPESIDPGDTPTIWVPVLEIPGATTVVYEFKVELVPISDDFCADDSCYVPVNLTSAFGTSQTVLFFGSWLLQDTLNDGKPDYKYRYRVYIRINGSAPLLIDELSIDTAVAKQALTVNVQNVYVPYCLDAYPLFDKGFFGGGDLTVDQSCELYWTVSINGVKYDGQVLSNEPPDTVGRSELDKKSVVSGSTIPINTPVTLEVPDVAGSCFDITLEAWESDSSNPNNNTGDDKLVSSEVKTHCRSRGWRAQDNIDQQTISARYYRYGTNSEFRTYLAEDVRAELTYTVTVP